MQVDGQLEGGNAELDGREQNEGTCRGQEGKTHVDEAAALSS